MMGEVALVVVMIMAIAITALNRSSWLQSGLIIVVVAAIDSFIPGMPRIHLEPELILGIVIPPLLYSAARNMSLFAFVRDLRTILHLGVGLVVVTTLVIGAGLDWVLGGITGSAAYVLASVVSPPDTVTIVSHGHKMGIPRRVINVLMGESLINDAVALTLFSFTISIAGGESTFISNPWLLFLYGSAVGILIGAVFGFIVTVSRSYVPDPTTKTVLTLLVPFAAYLVAEQTHASGILAVVVASLLINANTFFDLRQDHAGTLYQTRLQERALWPTVDMLLESFVFSYIGLQTHHTINALQESGESFSRAIFVTIVVLILLVAIRFASVSWYFYRLPRLQEKMATRISDIESAAKPNKIQVTRLRKAKRRSAVTQLNRKEQLLVSWTGMRGILTLAAAAGIPAIRTDGSPFPHYATIQFVAFAVAIVSLIVQGTTLPLLARKMNLDLHDEDVAYANDIAKARQIANEAPPVSGKSRWESQRIAVTEALMNPSEKESPLDDRAIAAEITRLDLEQSAADLLNADQAH